MNPSGPGLFLVGRLLIAASNSALVIGLFRVPPGLVLVEYKCQGIHPFLPGLPVTAKASQLAKTKNAIKKMSQLMGKKTSQ